MTCKPTRYPLDAPFGRFYVFNNMEFIKLRLRGGSDLDARALNEVANKYNFISEQPFENFTAGEFFEKLNDIRNGDYSQISCLAIAFLSHGSEGQIAMKDYGVNVDNIVQCLSEIEGLQGKPKILIFQACRGVRIAERGAPINSDDMGEANDLDLREANGFDLGEADCPVSESGKQSEYQDVGVDLISALPLGADFIMCNSTTKNHVSFRDCDTGSRFIQTFCRVLNRYAEEPDELDFLQLLTKISSEVAMTNPEDPRRQIPSFTSTLTKSLYLPLNTGRSPTFSRENQQ